MKVTINGKEYECQEIKIKTEAGEIVINSDIDKKKTGYERVSIGNIYHSESMNPDIRMKSTELDDKYSNADYNNANYYSSEEVAKNNARADRLIRQLRRFSVENRKDINWTDNKECGYYLAYNYQRSIIEIAYTFTKKFLVQYILTHKSLPDEQ